MECWWDDGVDGFQFIYTVRVVWVMVVGDGDKVSGVGVD